MYQIARGSPAFGATKAFLCGLIACGGVCGLPRAGQAALAKMTGGSGYSAGLSHQKQIRHQQLICDPAVTGAEAGTPIDAYSGSTSVTYDANVVSLEAVYNSPGYTVLNGYVEVKFTTGMFKGTKAAVTLQDFFNGVAGAPDETGYVQVQWLFNGNPTATNGFGAHPSDTGNFTPDGTVGVNGADSHGLEFGYLPVPDGTVAGYTVYADPGGKPIFDITGNPTDASTQADVLMGQNADSSLFVAPYPYSPASISGSLDGVPEPASLGLLALASIGLLARRRSRRP